MNNNEVIDTLTAHRDFLNTAINGARRYREEITAGRWTGAGVKAAVMRQVKADALEGGLDISAWDGTPAP